MSVPLNELPEHTVYDQHGIIIDRGWRSIIGRLLSRRLLRPTKKIRERMGQDDIWTWIEKGKGFYDKKHHLVTTRLSV